MSAHDTSEAVEALLNRVHHETNGGGMVRWCAPDVANEAAAMLRRLHQRAVDAEDQASRAISAAENWHHEARRMRGALATARADALREAAALADGEWCCECPQMLDVGEVCCGSPLRVCDTALPSRILALTHPTTTGET